MPHDRVKLFQVQLCGRDLYQLGIVTVRLKSQEVLKHVLRHATSRNSCFASSHGIVLGNLTLRSFAMAT